MEKKNESIIRVALIGPESTAKSTLTEALALHYKTVLVKEFAREYIAAIDRKYTMEDLLFIAKEQLKQEKKALSQANQFLFADTELIISKVWCEDVFKTCPDWITHHLIENKYDLYLLTYPDIPWEQDSVRENPTRRTFFYEWYERELNNIQADYSVIKGEGEVRFKNCITAIENFLSNSKINL